MVNAPAIKPVFIVEPVLQKSVLQQYRLSLTSSLLELLSLQFIP